MHRTQKIEYKTLWFSDFHLGTKRCRADDILYVLDNVKADTIYLVGDIIDGWAMSRGKTYFPQSHVNIIRKLLSKAKNGTKIYYAAGNHDDFLLNYLGEHLLSLGNIIIDREFIYESNNKKFLVLHGDTYDYITRHYKFISKLGDIGYTFICWLNHRWNTIKRFCGFHTYSTLSSKIKKNFKKAMVFIGDFKKVAIKEATNKGCNGTICGHIHVPSIEEFFYEGTIYGIYGNCGDFVENSTFIGETIDNVLLLLKVEGLQNKEIRTVGEITLNG